MTATCLSRPCLLTADDDTLTALIEQIRETEGFSSPPSRLRMRATVLPPPRPLKVTVDDYAMRIRHQLSCGATMSRSALLLKICPNYRKDRCGVAALEVFNRLLAAGELVAVPRRVPTGVCLTGRPYTTYRLAARQERSA